MKQHSLISVTDFQYVTNLRCRKAFDISHEGHGPLSRRKAADGVFYYLQSLGLGNQALGSSLSPPGGRAPKAADP